MLATTQELSIELPESENLTVGFDLECNVEMTPAKGRQGKTVVATIAHDNAMYLLQIAWLHEDLSKSFDQFLFRTLWYDL